MCAPHHFHFDTVFMGGTRLQIVGAFVLFALLAAPAAWHLTQVERMELPVERIQQLSWDSSRFGGTDKFHVDVFSLGSSSVPSSALPSSTPNVDFSADALVLTAEQKMTLQKAVESGLQATDDALKLLKKTQHKRFSVFLLCDEKAPRSGPVLTVGKHRHAWSSQCQVKKGDSLYFAIETLVQRHVYPHKDEQSVKRSVDTRTARRALRYRLQFSLLKENPITPWHEDLRVLVDQYLGRFVLKVGAVATFAVETQVVQYARLAKEITPSADGTAFYVSADDLKHVRAEPMLAVGQTPDCCGCCRLCCASSRARTTFWTPQCSTMASRCCTSWPHCRILRTLRCTFVRRVKSAVWRRRSSCQGGALQSFWTPTHRMASRPPMIRKLRPKRASCSASWASSCRSSARFLACRRSPTGSETRTRRRAANRGGGCCSCRRQPMALPSGSWTLSCATASRSSCGRRSSDYSRASPSGDGRHEARGHPLR